MLITVYFLNKGFALCSLNTFTSASLIKDTISALEYRLYLVEMTSS